MAQTNYDRQAKLAQSAGLPELQALSQGANPRLVQPFVALGTLNARMAQMQSDKMLQGAAPPGSIPTLREKIEQSLQRMKAQAAQQQAAQQAQQQAPGMFQVPQGTPTPQEQPQAEDQAEGQPVMQARAGGLARLPVNDRMFGYAGGGIIAFNGDDRSDVPRPIGQEAPLSPEERDRLERELLMRVAGERARAGVPDEVPANLKNPNMNVTDLDFLSIPGMEKSDVLQRAMDSISQKRGPESPTSAPAPASSPTKPLARPIGQEAPLPPEERARLERELEMRLIGERARAGATGEPSRPTVDDAASRIPGQSVRAPSAGPVERDDAASRIPGQSVRAPVSGTRADSSELGRNISNTMAALPGAGAVKGFFGGIRGALGGLGSLANREDNQGLSFVPVDSSEKSTSTVKPAPTGKPQLQGPRTLVGDAADEHARLAKAHENFTGGQKLVGGMTYGQAVETARQKNGGTLTREQLEIINRRFAGAEADAGIKLLPGATPGKNVTKPSVTTPTDTPPQNEISELMAELKKQYGPQPAVESTEDRLKKRDDYVKNAPTSEEALALLKHFDRMAKRYEANDQAEEAQKARNAENNLATFLMNTRGGSLGIAAGKANAALQPLLADQETRRQTYQKQRDEQENLLGKSRYEVAQAERARKEGRYADAEKHEMEAKKLQEQARGHNIQGLTSLLNAAGQLEERRLGREQQYLMHRERMGELSVQRQRMADEANRIKEQGERTQREAVYGRQSKDVLERIRKAQTLLSMPNLSKEQKTKTETLLEGYQREDNDLYERIVVRGDKDYRPSPKGSGGNSALTKKADQIVGVK